VIHGCQCGAHLEFQYATLWRCPQCGTWTHIVPESVPSMWAQALYASHAPYKARPHVPGHPHQRQDA
jgi:hypothetical protein